MKNAMGPPKSFFFYLIIWSTSSCSGSESTRREKTVEDSHPKLMAQEQQEHVYAASDKDSADGISTPKRCAKTSGESVTRVDNVGYAIKVSLCSGDNRIFQFEHPVVDIKPNSTYRFVAVYTSSYFDHIPKEGEDALPDTLFIVDLRANTMHQYTPAWSPKYHYDLWSPEGTYGAFLTSDEGPIDIVKTVDLPKYLDGYEHKYREVSANKNPTELNPPQAHEVIGWSTDTILLFENGCCGDNWKTQYDNTYLRLECWGGYCETIGYKNLESFEKDIDIKNGKLTKYAVSREINRYLKIIEKRCFSKEKQKSQNNTEGTFGVTFKLTLDGQITQTSVKDLETSNSIVNESALRTCLIESATQMTFEKAQISGTETVSFQVTMRSKE